MKDGFLRHAGTQLGGNFGLQTGLGSGCSASFFSLGSGSPRAQYPTISPAVSYKIPQCRHQPMEVWASHWLGIDPRSRLQTLPASKDMGFGSELWEDRLEGAEICDLFASIGSLRP